MKKILYISLSLSFVFSQNIFNNENLDKSTEDLTHHHLVCGSSLFTDEYIEAQRVKMQTYYPDEYQRMLLPPRLNKTYSLGMTQKFWVTVDDGNGGEKDEEITAQLLAQGTYSAIWADVNQIGADQSNIDANTALEYLAFLEDSTPSTSFDSTKGAHELVTQYFGSAPNKDGDGIIDYLFADLYPGAAGYFSPSDQGNGAGSNRRDILYIDVFSSQSYATATISHELQHLIHSNYVRKDLKMNEGMSEVASYIAGMWNGVRPNTYLSRVGQVGWDWEGGSEHYSMGFLFMLYFAEQLGFESLLKFQETAATGWNAFQRVLNVYNVGLNYQQWIGNWHIANYLNNKSIDSAYGYDWSRVGRANASFWHTDGYVPSTPATILSYDANYVYYSSGADSLPITFSTSGIPVNVTSIEYKNDTLEVKKIENNQEYIVKDDNSTVTSAAFIVSNLNNTESLYSYKSNGANTGGWFATTELAYDDGEVDVFTQSDGNTFGYLGWGGRLGWGWGVEFDPRVSENQLLSASINMGFAQDFSSGSTIPESADKDFDLHIWKTTDDNGNIENVLPPIKIDGKARGITGIGWVNIDLSSYAEQLTNLGKVVIGVVDDDTLGVYFGMSNDIPVTKTYAYEAGTLNSISNYLSGGATLDGWNFMFRTNWKVKNTTVPNLHAGFMQNSIFNDQLKIYVLGNSIFNNDDIEIYAENQNELMTLNSLPLASNDSIRIADYKLKTSGGLDIRATGTYLYSNARFDTTFKYSVGLSNLSKPLQISSRDGVYTINLNKESFSEKSFLVTGKNSYTGRNALDLSIVHSDVYTTTPLNKELGSAAHIVFNAEGLNASDYSIGYWNDDQWKELISYASIDGKTINAHTQYLGHFALIEKGSGSSLSVINESIIPTEFALEQNFPNPFNPDTKISYDIAHSGTASIVIYDILGRKILDLVNEYKTPGKYNTVWNGNDALGNPMGSGIYLYQLKTNTFSSTKKMVLSR